MTLMSGKVYSDFGVPSNTIGEQGDIFMQLDGLKITYRKEGVAWTPIGNQLGTIPEFLKGVGVPSNVLGQDNQYYRNVTTQVIYQKNAGVWNNIGSWTSLQVTQVLDQGGVGKDLGTAPNAIPAGDLNTIIEAGEYSFASTLTNTPFRVVNASYTNYGGLLKVWRKNTTNIYQFVETTNGLLTSRSTADGGTTWTDWVFAANEEGNDGIQFKVLNAGLDEEATNLGQVKTLIEHYYSSIEGGNVNNGTLELKNNQHGHTQFKFNYYGGGPTSVTITISPNSSPQPSFCNGVWLSKVGSGAVPTLTSVTATNFTVSNPSGEGFYWIALIDFNS